jgi:hypothetical protein
MSLRNLITDTIHRNKESIVREISRVVSSNNSSLPPSYTALERRMFRGNTSETHAVCYNKREGARTEEKRREEKAQHRTDGKK